MILCQFVLCLFLLSPNDKILEGHKSALQINRVGDSDSFSVQLDTGDYIEVKVSFDTYDIVIYIYDSKEHLIDKFVPMNQTRGPFLLTYTAPKDDAYRVSIQAIEPSGANVTRGAGDRGKNPFQCSIEVIKKISKDERLREVQDLKDSLEVKWLNDNLVPVASIDPYDENFEDLNELGEALKDVKIVLLGEQTHLDSQTLKAKVRLVKYLHEMQGFTILAFENNIYSLFKANELLSCQDEYENVFNHAFSIAWSKTHEAKPLFEYLESSFRREKPLNVLGFDCQFYDSLSFKYMENDLYKHLSSHGIKNRDEFDKFWTLFDNARRFKYFYKELDPPSNDETEFLKSYLQKCFSVLESVNSKSRLDYFWLQIIKSIGINYQSRVRMLSPDYDIFKQTNIRDKQMAENLISILENTAPDQKVIVWAATFHNARNLSQIKMMNDAYEHEMYVTLGDYLYEKYQNKMYSLGFTTSKGYYGIPKFIATSNHAWDKYRILENMVSEIELEEMLEQTKYTYSFLNLRNSPKWLQKPLISRPLGHVPAEAPWPQILDGLIYTKNMDMLTSIPKKTKTKN